MIARTEGDEPRDSMKDRKKIRADVRQLVIAALKNGDGTAAVEALERVLADDEDFRIDGYYLLARLHGAAGDRAKTLKAFAASGIGKKPKDHSAQAIRDYAEALFNDRQHQVLQPFLIHVLEMDDLRGDSKLSLLLAKSVLTEDTTPNDVDAIVGAAILSTPKDRLIIESWFDHLRKAMPEDDVVKTMTSLQNRTESPLFGVLMALQSRLGNAGVRSEFADLIKAQKAASPAIEYAAVWSAMLSGQPLASDACTIVAKDRSGFNQFFFHFMEDVITQMPLLGRKAEKTLSEAGIKFREFDKFVSDFIQISNADWLEELESSTITDDLSREAFMKAEEESGFLDRIVADRKLEFMDPYTGELVEAAESIIAYGRTIYVFKGKEVFYLVCGKPWSAPLGIVIPRLSVSIPFSASPSSLVGEHMANVYCALIQRAARNALKKIAPVEQGAQKAITVSVPGTENFAHHVWNFYSAIERIIKHGALENVDRFIFSGTEFFGPLGVLFPEIASRLERPPRNNIIDPYPQPGSGLVVQTGGFSVPRSLIERIIRVMGETKKSIPAARDPSDFDLSARPPVIWLAMRLRDKGWVDQEAGISLIIKTMAQRFPDAVFLLDGFSFPVGKDNISNAWADVIDGLSAMADRIVEAAAVPNLIVNMVGNSLRESVLWAEQTDVYLAPYGTTQHKIGWFSKGQGLVYVPPNFSPDIARRSPGASAVDFGPMPEFIFVDAAAPGERRGLNRTRERFSNVSLDAAHAAEVLTELLHKRLKDTR